MWAHWTDPLQDRQDWAADRGWACPGPLDESKTMQQALQQHDVVMHCCNCLHVFCYAAHPLIFGKYPPMPEASYNTVCLFWIAVCNCIDGAAAGLQHLSWQADSRA